MVQSLTFKEPSADAQSLKLTLRPSDYDVNGHVSNVTYGQFLDTALSKMGYKLENSFVSLSYVHEIMPDVKEVTVKAEKDGDKYLLGVYSGEVCNCLGEVWNG
jgi:acyl-ACP thioesterase